MSPWTPAGLTSVARPRAGGAVAAAVALATVLLMAACSSTSSSTPTTAEVATTVGTTAPATPTTPATTTTLFPTYSVAHARVPQVEVFEEPGQGEPVHTLANPRPFYGSELVFLVRERQPDWLKVLVPVRPNGTEGWIRVADVETFSHSYRIVVELEKHLLTVYEGAEVFHQEPVGLGVGTTPTPGGLFYTLELLEVGPSQPEYGPYAYGLSGYSEVLYSFAGGDGQFGIHGTNNTSGLGTDVSNGCIRMSNEGITKLAETLPIGVPVEIRA